MKEEVMLQEVLEAISSLNLKDLVCFDFNEINPFYRYNIICTATSDRQLNAVSKHLSDYAFDKKIDYKIEGKNKATWVLVDLKDVIVNVFTAEEREHFSLEKLYLNVPQVDISEFSQDV